MRPSDMTTARVIETNVPKEAGTLLGRGVLHQDCLREVRVGVHLLDVV